MEGSAPTAEPLDEDRSRTVRVEIGEDVRERLANDPTTVGRDPVLAHRQACAFQREQLVTGAVERHLLLVTLPPAPRLGDVCLRLLVDKSLSRSVHSRAFLLLLGG